MALEPRETIFTKFKKLTQWIPKNYYPCRVELSELSIAKKHARNLFLHESDPLNPEKIEDARQFLLKLQNTYFPLPTDSYLILGKPSQSGLFAFMFLVSVVASDPQADARVKFLGLVVNCLILVSFLNLLGHEGHRLLEENRHFYSGGVRSTFNNSVQYLKSNLLPKFTILNQNRQVHITIDISPLLNCDIKNMQVEQLLDLYQKLYSSELLQIPQAANNNEFR